MIFLANENFPYPSITILRNAGFIVESIHESSPGISDNEVIKMAKNTNAPILTFDKDYGEIIFRYNFLTPPSVIFFRHKGNDPTFAGLLLLGLLENKSYKLENSFTVIEMNDVRQRKYS